METENHDTRHGHNQTINHGHYSRRPAGGVSQRGGRSRARGPGRRSGAPSGVMRFVDSMMSPFVQCFQPSLDPCADINMPICGTVCGSGAPPPPPPPPPPPHGRRHPTSLNTTTTQAAAAGTHHPAPPGGGGAVMVTPVAASRRLPQQQQHISPSQSFVAQPPPLQRIVVTTDVKKNPSEADVLCGRGGNSNRHNIHFRELVAANKAIYVTLTKKQKMMFSRQVVDTIHQAGGRFLAKDPATGHWSDIGLSRSLEKASQALREKGTNNTTTTTTNNNNNNTTSVIISDEGVEATAEIEPSSTKPNPRTIEAPRLIVPQSLQHVYMPKKTPMVSPESFRQQEWVAEFPSTFPHEQEWVAEFPSTFPQQPLSSYHPSDHRVHNNNNNNNMPAPHMGNIPFSTRQMSRLNHRRQTTNRVRSVPANSTAAAHPMMVSPTSTSMIPHPLSWQQSLYNDPAVSSSTHGGKGSDASTTSTTAAFETEYPSSATSCCNSTSSAQTQSPPDFHQYYRDFEPPPSTSASRTIVRTTTAATATAATATTHPHPLQEHPQEVKRQRTRDEEKREGIMHEEQHDAAQPQVQGEEKEEEQEEEVILLDSDHQTTLNNSLQEGSEQLPKEVESKLCLHEKVICSPSEMLQGRGGARRRGHHNDYHGNSSSIMTSTSPILKEKPTNTSAEAADMTGLTALSAAAYLRLDEGE